MKQVIAITGATGFIGQSICQRLASQNYSLRALIRSSGQQSLPALQGAEVIRGDLADPASLQHLVEGAAAVIHCAGRVRGATQAQFDHVNVDGIRNLVRAIKSSSSPPRLLSISSLAAREPGLSFYAASKHQAEQVLRTQCKGIAWTVLRPPAVYGPGDRELLPLFRLMARGIALTPGSPTARFSLLYVEDLSLATLAWLRGNPGAGKIYTIDDGQPDGYDWHDLGSIVGELCDRQVRFIRPASWLLDFPARINSVLAKITGGLPMLTPEKLRELRHHDWVCNNAEFRRDIDWQPRFSLAAGLKATPNWPGHVPSDSARQ